MSAIPLPEGSNAADMIRRLRAIDAEIFGTLYANAGLIGGDVTIEGTLTAADIISSVWESGGGTVPLSLPDAGATTGYAVEDSAGIAQFQALYASGANITDLVASEITVGQLVEGQIADNAITADKLSVTSLDAITANMGTLTVDSTLTMGTGGVLRTAVSGQRLELAESFGDRINWYTADASESSPGTVFAFYAGSAGTGNLSLNLHSPQNTTRNTQTRLVLYAQSASGTSGPEVEVLATGTYNIQPVVRFVDFILRVDDGTTSAPAFSFNSELDTGMYLSAGSDLAWTVGGNTEMVLSDVAFRVPNVYISTTGGAINVHVGTDGRMYRNNSSRKYKNRINYNVDYLADIELKPSKHWRIDDKQWRYSLIAEDLEAEDKLLVDGDSPNYNAVIAVMAAKINRLEAKLQELEDGS